MKYEMIRDHVPKIGQNIVIVGPRRSGKTTLAHGLYSSLMAAGRPVELKAEHPKFCRRSHRCEIAGDPEITIWDMDPPPEVADHPFTRWISVPPIVE